MGGYALSRKADEDIEGIARFTIEQWGAAQAEVYIRGLHSAFRKLASFPQLGRDASSIRDGYRRHETAGHVIFYRQNDDGVLIVRVLHERMDVTLHR